MSAMTGGLRRKRAALGTVLGVAVGTIIGGTVTTGGPILVHLLFTRPAILRAEHWTAYEYVVESFGDTELKDALNRRGKAGWQVVSSRRAVGDHGNGRYEFVLCRPSAEQKPEDIDKADFELHSAHLDQVIARMSAQGRNPTNQP